jgi:uncharacterized protein YdcH (DUF465 family)
MEIIPFRESKLTHLLMPILSRAGLGGVAMIACVNPQIDDYDETLSILGNASIASKIREFAEVGRTAAQTVPCTAVVPVQQQPQQSTSNTTTTTTASKIIKLEELREYNTKQQQQQAQVQGQKRRREESAVGVAAVPVLQKQPSKKMSVLGLIKTNSQKSMISSSSSSAASSAVSSAANSRNTSMATQGYEDDENLSERKKLKREIEILQTTNNQLMLTNITRETEIREEISKEMMSRSNGLLSKISDLQSQLSVYETQNIHDIMSRSVKKAKQSKVSLENDEIVQQLRESEDEIERMKLEYEYEIQKLKYENFKLKDEINLLKEVSLSNGNNAAVTVAPTAGGNKRKNSKDVNFENENGNMNNKVNVGMDIKKSPLQSQQQRSPNRSPLSPISNNSPKLNGFDNYTNKDGNNSPKQHRSISPKKEYGGGNGMSNNNGSVKLSPQRLVKINSGTNMNNQNDMNTNKGGNVPYLTRLRSQLVRL